MTSLFTECGVGLFDGVDAGALRLRNRIALSPMSQHCATEGRANEWHLVHYGSRAAGGCGLVMVEDTAVAPAGRVSRGALGLYDDRHIAPLRRIVNFCHERGAAVGIQVNHAGPKAFGDQAEVAHERLSAAGEPYSSGWAAPRAATGAELAGVVEAFRQATGRAVAAGFDVVEVHSTHGYLLHELLTPLRNSRSDEYGGSNDGRAQLLLDVVATAAAELPADRMLAVRLPARDGHVNGLQLDDVVRVVEACVARGAGLVAIAGQMPVAPGRVRVDEHVETVRAVRAQVPDGLAISIGGGIGSRADAERLLQESGATLLSVGRPLLVDPYWPLHAAIRGVEIDALVPAAYAKAWR